MSMKMKYQSNITEKDRLRYNQKALRQSNVEPSLRKPGLEMKTDDAKEILWQIQLKGMENVFCVWVLTV